MPANFSPELGQRVPIPDLHHFSTFDRSFAARDPALRNFLSPIIGKKTLEDQLRRKSETYLMREALCRCLDRQYTGMELPKAVSDNLLALRHPGTFSVTTAHQPLLFGGKLYVLYKALSTILLARSLTELLGSNIVPIFVIGSEDHDLEEVRYFKLFHSQLAWEPVGLGPVGRKPMHNIPQLLLEAENAFKTLPFGQYAIELLRASYGPMDTFAGSFRKLLHQLLGPLGLIIVDPDDAELKRGFGATIKEELSQGFSLPLVTSNIASIEAAGFKAQAHPREINLFYLDEGVRARIERNQDGIFHAIDTPYTWTASGIEALVDEHPEMFSPNVILRPLYQETILPNLAFIGGGGELAYWIQLKEVFQAKAIPYPILHRRQSACLVDQSTRNRMDKLGIGWEDLSSPIEEKLKEFVLSLEKDPVDLSNERAAMMQVLEGIRERARSIDSTLQRSLDATEHQIIKLLESFETRMVRGVKHRHESEVQQFRNLFDKVHPNQSLQERHEDFMTWIARFGPDLIDRLLASIQPLEPDFVYLDL